MSCVFVQTTRCIFRSKRFCWAFAGDLLLTWDDQELPVGQLDSSFQMGSTEEVHRNDEVKDTRQVLQWNSCCRPPHSSLFRLLRTGQGSQPSCVVTRSSSKPKSETDLEQGGRPGISAWKRWILWRRSQTNLYLVSGGFVSLYFRDFVFARLENEHFLPLYNSVDGTNGLSIHVKTFSSW